MKIAFSFIAIFLFFTISNAQSQKISKDEYEKVFQFAVSKTNADYPVILKVVVNNIKNGKTISTKTETVENEAQGRSRQKTTVLKMAKKQTNTR